MTQEERVAILRQVAKTEDVHLPDTVAIYVAERVISDRRELAGFLMRLIAYASLTGQEITLGLTQEMLQKVAPPITH